MHIILDIVMIIAVLFLLAFLVSFLCMQMYFVRNKSQNNDTGFDTPVRKMMPGYEKYYEDAKKGIEYLKEQKTEEVSITSFDGITLRGYFFAAEEPTNRTMLLIHGYRSYGIYEFGARVEFLHSLGWNLLIADNRAHGRSDGKYIGFGVLDAFDVIKWCEYINDRIKGDTAIVLHGISMGGATVTAAAGLEGLPSNVVGVIEDCGYTSGFEQVEYQIGRLAHLPKFPFLYMVQIWLRIVAHYSLKDNAPVELIGNYKGKLLVIHGAEDDFVPTFMAKRIYDAAVCEKEMWIVSNAAHAKSYTVAEGDYRERLKRFLEI